MMKLDYKKLKVQQKYREELKRKKVSKKQTLEAAVVISLLILLLSFIPFFEEETEVDSAEVDWMSVLPIIDDELKSKPYYTGIAIDFNPKPIKIIVRTTINEANSEAEHMENELLSIVNTIIEINGLPYLLEDNEVYLISIEGKSHQELKRKVYR